MDRPADLAGAADLLDLAACAGLPAARVGRKAALLAWAGRHGIATPGGAVLDSGAFWAVLARAGVARRARYLQEAALALAPDHAHRIAAAIRAELAAAPLAGWAAAAAAAAFARVGGAPLVCRSSAAMEDRADAAFPGIFVSVLDIADASGLAAAMAACWRSAFSETAIAYLLRVRPAVVDLSLALLVQRQVPAAWYGVYFSVDPVSGAGAAVAELSDAAPDALVGGAPPARRLAWDGMRWHGADAGLAARLDRVAAAAALLETRLAGPIDLEFALPADAAAPPVILQARPLRLGARAGPDATADMAAAGAGMVGVACAPGHAVGLGVRLGAAGTAGATIGIAARVTTADYPALFGHAGVVAQAASSPLSHVAILCREFGIPLVAGIADASRWLGRPLAVDGARGLVHAAATAAPAPDIPAPLPPAEVPIAAAELLVRLVAAPEAADPAAAACAAMRAHGRSLGAARVRLVAPGLSEADLRAFDRLGAEVFGPGFSAARLLAALPDLVECRRGAIPAGGSGPSRPPDCAA